MFEVKDAGFRGNRKFGGSSGWLFRNVNFVIHPGEVVALMGASGSGKSTLLNGVSGLGKLDEGAGVLDGVKLSGVSQRVLRKNLRSNMSIVFQQHHLIPGLTLLQNVELSWCLSGRKGELTPTEVLDELGIGEERYSLPESVSGGQAQRAAIARSLVTGSQLVFADEPTGSLDIENAQAVMVQMKSLCQQRGGHALVVTHDHDIAATCDRILVLAEGTIRHG